MPRDENPLAEGSDPVLEFARDLRLLRVKAGKPTYRALSLQAHYSEAALSQAAAGRKLPSLAVALAYVSACGGSVQEWERRWREVSAALEPSARQDLGEPPYQGLAPFRAEDAQRYFGRESLAAEVVSRLAEQRVVVIVGTSGAGKSSLLHAGVIPRLTSRAVLFTPGRHPLEECLIKLGSLSAGEVTLSAENPRAVHHAVRQAVAEGDELVLVVDQFEEVFTLCSDHAERTRFIDQLLTAAFTSNSGCRVVLSVRADFYGHCVGHRDLSEVLREGQVTVTPMTADELRRAIVQPALRVDCVVETSLVTRIVADASGQPGVLPLLSHVLLETWHRRRGATLTLQGYEAAGGIEHAVAHTAEQAFTALSLDQRRTARQVFLRLCVFGDTTEDTKRRARRAELDQLGRNAHAVLEHLARERLVVLGEDDVEIAHEALIRSWPRLRGWLVENREGLRVHRDVTEGAASWRALDEDPGALYRGVRLATAQAWAEHHDDELSGPERDFLAASIAARERAESDERRRTSRLRGLVALLSVLLLVAGGATWAALRAERTAATQRNAALAQKVASQVLAMRTTEPALAGQLALAAYRLDPTVDTRGSLLSSVAGPRTTVVTAGTARKAVAFSPNGELLATAGEGRAVSVWRLPSVHAPRPVVEIVGRSERVESLAFSPDGSRLAAAGHDGTVSLWSLDEPEKPRLLAEPPGHDEAVYHVAFSPDGFTLITASQDGTAALWDIRDPSTPTRISVLSGHQGAVSWAEFDRGGRAAVTASDDGTVRLWDVSDSTSPTQTSVLTTHAPRATSAEFSPDGALLLTAGFDTKARLWDLRAVGGPREVAQLSGHRDTVQSARFSPAGSTVITTSWDYTAKLWDVSTPSSPTVSSIITGHTNTVWASAFSTDGHVVATASDDGAVRLTDVPGRLLGGHTDTVRASAISADGRTVATGSRDGTVRLWDTSDPDRPRRLVLPDSAMGPIRSVALSATTLAAGDAEGRVRLWDVRDPANARLLPAGIKHPGTARALAFSPDGALLAVGGDDLEHVVRLWSMRDPSAPALAGEIAGATDFIPALAFSPRGDVLAIAMTRTVRLIDVTNPAEARLLSKLEDHGDRVLAVDFAPDGRHLVSGGLDRTARLWDVRDVRSPSPVSRLTGHNGAVSSVRFSTDGSRIATGGFDRTARLWDVTERSGPVVWAVLSGHSDEVHTVSFFPDDRYLLTGGRDTTGRLWRTSPEDAAAEVCGLVHPSTTPQQWAVYFPDTDVRAPCP